MDSDSTPDQPDISNAAASNRELGPFARDAGPTNLPPESTLHDEPRVSEGGGGGRSAAPAALRRPPGLHWIDLVLFALLVAFASAGFYRHSAGDLYTDEADYALASTRGFEASRWDRSDNPKEPDKLVAGRHYHAPLTVDLIGAAHHFGAADNTLRVPFIAAGGLSVGMVYLCGLALFDRRREIGIACALLVTISPAIVRMAAHALPWSPIIFELLVLLWCLAEYTRGYSPGWIVGCFAALAALFVTSEMFFVALPAVAIAAPFLLWTAFRGTHYVGQADQRAQGTAFQPRDWWVPFWWRDGVTNTDSRGVVAQQIVDRDLPSPNQARVGDVRRAESGRRLTWALAGGAILFLAIVFIIWPSGLMGGSIKMLRHYMQMRHSDSFPVNVGSQVFAVAPKWSYAYWYWNDYRPFSVCYLIGIPAIFALAVARRLHLSLLPLLSLTALLVFAAHRAHIIGPEYLAHCLPFLTLLGGYSVYAMSLVWRPLSIVALVCLAVPVVRWHPRVPLPGMDARSQVSRWPAASRFLASQWKHGDKIVVGSQPVAVARWYLLYQGNLPPVDSQFQALPVHAPRPLFLDRLQSGFYRYAAVSNMFEDNVDLDVSTRRILKHWTIAWRSNEHGTGPSRLTIYHAPAPLVVKKQ